MWGNCSFPGHRTHFLLDVSGCRPVRRGQTPDETYLGTGDAVAAELAGARKAAREEQIKANRTVECGVCAGEADSKVLLLQRPRSRMA